MDLDLDGKVVVITGASGGIGSVLARQFLKQGCRVALIARTQDRLLGVAEKLKQEFNNEKILALPADCLDEKLLSEAIANVISKWKKIDVAIANIGDGRSEQDPIPTASSFAKAFRTNVDTAVNLSRAVKLELQKSQGNLLFIASIAGLKVIGAPTDYSAAKAALVMLAKQLAQKLAPEVRVNCIAPGNIFFEGGRWDELLQSNREIVEEMISSSVPLQKFGTPMDVATAALFLCSSRAAFITGACLTVDGGQTTASQ